MMALMLSPGEEEVLRAQFMALDRKQRGAISLQELKTVLGADDRCVEETFAALCSARVNGTEDEVRYSDFLAAMIPSHLSVSDNLLRSAFRKFDNQGNGAIAGSDLDRLVGGDFQGAGVEELL